MAKKSGGGVPPFHGRKPPAPRAYGSSKSNPKPINEGCLPVMVAFLSGVGGVVWGLTEVLL